VTKEIVLGNDERMSDSVGMSKFCAFDLSFLSHGFKSHIMNNVCVFIRDSHPFHQP
jgi:hypothetical protein